MLAAQWTEQEISAGYLEMAQINSDLAEAFRPLENEAESSNLGFITNLK